MTHGELLPQAAPVLDSLPPPPEPPALAAAHIVHGPTPTPEQRIYFYGPDEWEVFILEWVTSLELDYVRVKRLAGSGDRGVDVAGFTSERGFEAPWDCYQCKHYEDVLTFADAWPEILKVVTAVTEGHYTTPRSYRFLAPMGCGPTLERLLSSPSKLRAKFLEQLEKPNTLRGYTDQQASAVRRAAAKFDYSIFDSADLGQVLEGHRRTRFYLPRFGGGFPARPPAPAPPDQPSLDETPYLRQLIDVYMEKFPIGSPDLQAALAHPKASEHLRRQRETFYSAEALRVFVRDRVPLGTFESLKNDVHSGTVDAHDLDYSTGYERLTAVLMTSTQIDLSANPLVSLSRPDDKKGICHHLANDDRFHWCGES